MKIKLYPRTETSSAGGGGGVSGYRMDCPSCSRPRAPTDYVGNVESGMLVSGEVVVRCGICGAAFRSRGQRPASPGSWKWSRLS